MSIIENYIDDIFKNHPYKDDIKKYVNNENDSINFNTEEIKFTISNNHIIYSNLLDLYVNDKQNDSLIRLFKVISMQKIENIYIFEILIINIISGMNIKEALLKCISMKKINDWNRDYKKYSYNINPISNEIMNAKINILIYYYYASKYFPKETEQYIENICSSNIDDIIKEYEDNILIALMALTIKIYFGDYSKIPVILEYSKKVNYLDSILSLFIILNIDDSIPKRFIELIENNMLNENKDLFINLAYMMRLFFLTRKNFSEKFANKSFDEFIHDLSDFNIPQYFIFLIKYLDTNLSVNSSKVFEGIKTLYSKDKESFYKLYNILKEVEIPYIIEIKAVLNCVLLNAKDDNADITVLDNNIDYFIENIKKELEKIYDIKSDNIFELLENKTINKYDLSVNISKELIFTTKIIVLMYDYNEKARKVVRALLKSLPYNLAIPLMIKDRKEFYNIKLKEILDYLQGYDLDLKDLIITYLYTYPIYIFSTKYILKLVTKNADYTIEMFHDKTFLKAASYKSYALIDFLELLYKKDKAGFTNYSAICYVLHLKNKDIIKCALRLIEEDEYNSRAYIESSIHAYRKEVQFELKKIIKKWNCNRKGFKFKTLEDINQYIDDYYDDDYENLIDFVDENLISDVLLRSDKSIKIPVKVMKYILIEYMLLDEPYRIKDIDRIIDLFDMYSLRSAFEKIYKYWSDNGCDENKKNIIIPYCIYADYNQIASLYDRIEYWHDNFKSSLAAYIIPAIAMNGEKFALMIINNIIYMSKNKVLKNAAISSFEKASECLNIPIDNLFDKVIPNLGFNVERNKIINYGKQSFTLQLLSDSYLEVIDNENHKIIKELPEPIEGDDKTKAEEAKKDLANIRNSLEAIITYQKEKLKKVMFNGRKWDYETFFEVFVENPVMQYFTLAFIWGVYDEEGNLIDCFRYMEDGSLISIDEDLYELPKQIKCYITLYHPIDSGEDTYKTWYYQLELYEIEQPVEQIKIKRYILEDTDVENNSIISFKGQKLSLEYMDKLSKELNIKIEYYNEYVSYYMADNVLKIICEIDCSMYDEDVLIESIKFYELEKYNKFGKIISPFDIERRFISTMIYYLSLGFYD
ncbi:MolR family transcriptional regulator [Brachyspira hampsonii]|uniref:MolR family transcriptional regulator n=4 Tax=Brachyspira hampsonii TaxID=1287055 RepID=A0AAC9XL34_9SPIR|nr:DUF4132 domain-containing protein [Brachyspira hampsonii]ASJ22437.1 MolR family transcriptional regulator [Brachyspira hampsonii]OEJ18211.1 MolR family transcriptional regulator [Brachyspira hampsonii]